MAGHGTREFAPDPSAVLVPCSCGCGSPTTTSWTGVDQVAYVHGHNRRLDLPSPNPSGLCMCGCGSTTSIAVRTNRSTGTVAGQPAQYLKGHKQSPKHHRLLTKDTEDRTGECSRCGPGVVIVSSTSRTDTSVRWRCRTGTREQMLWKNYKIDSEQYLLMLEEQNYRCASCQVAEHDWDRPLHVDHDHVSGGVIALLCSPCNRAAGLLQEDPDYVARLWAYVTYKKEKSQWHR